MRTLDELKSGDPAMPLVRSWIASGTRSVDVLPVDRARSEEVLVALQVTTRSPMGAIALETGGLVIDRWLRVLGGGGPRMDGDLARWNGLGPRPLLGKRDRSLIVAHDAIGGFFALDGGGLGSGTGEVFYFAPDSLAWEGIDMGYSDWLDAMLNQSIIDFYAENRWDGWEREAATLEPDQGFSIYPPLWTEESRPIEKASRKAVPMVELWKLQLSMRKQQEAKYQREGVQDEDDAGFHEDE